MTLQEHKAILAFLDQVTNAAQQPLDVEADAIIRAYFKRHPDTAYRLTRLAMAAMAPVQPAADDAQGDTPHAEDEPRRRRWLPLLGDRRVPG